MPIVESFGADAARCYILFIGPPDQDAAWSESSLEGVHKFLGRLWRLADELQDVPTDVALAGDGAADPLLAEQPVDPTGRDLEVVRKAHWAINKVTGDMIDRFAFNTALAAIMELVNEVYKPPRAGLAAQRFATATAASLVCPCSRPTWVRRRMRC